MSVDRSITQAGCSAWKSYLDCPAGRNWHDGMADAYRAMRAAEAAIAGDARGDFEDWAMADNRCVQPQDFEERTPSNGCYYIEDSTNHAYIGWREGAARAAAALQNAPKPEVVEPQAHTSGVGSGRPSPNPSEPRT